MNLANLMREPRIKKHALCCRGLTGVDVGDNSNISIASYRRSTRHNLLRLTVLLNALDSKSIVGKRFVCVGHAVRILTLSNR